MRELTRKELAEDRVGLIIKSLGFIYALTIYDSIL